VVIDATKADEDFCYLTTKGRVTGRRHEIEIWFALDGATFYFLAGGGYRSDWVRNLRVDPAVTVRLGGARAAGRGRVVEDQDEQRRARALVFAKYQPRYHGSLEGWRESSLPVAVDLG